MGNREVSQEEEIQQQQQFEMNTSKEEDDEERLNSPFSHFTSEDVFRELDVFETCIGSKYERCCFESKKDIHHGVVPMIEWDHVTIESVLGEGAFSFVFQVTIEKHEKHQRYALKCLKAKGIKSSDDLMYNAMDLYTEALILAQLDHPHIIQLKGISNRTLSDSFKIRSGGYFVLLDIMEKTLFEKLLEWRYEPDPKAKKASLSKAGIVKRLREVAIPVADAMSYLHNHKIVFRDLKPENIGFEVSTGRVKLFDFGLAREITLVDDGDVAGSILYMAPEILLEKETRLASDVYSFSIVLWELCTLQIPFERFTDKNQVVQKVAKGGWRLSTVKIPSKTLRQLLTKNWADDPEDRSSFLEIHETLCQVCYKEKYQPLQPFEEDTKTASTSHSTSIVESDL